MKVLLLNGSPHESGCTYRALSEFAMQLKKYDIDFELFQLGHKNINACIDCQKCFGKGRCVFNDSVNEVIQHILSCDGLVIGSPVYFGGIPGNLKCLLDRVFYDSKRLFALKPASAIVSCRRGGASTAFDALNKYFMISSMPVISSQYWNSVHGDHPEEITQDQEGLQTIRLLADNMAFLLKCIECGKKSGIEPVKQENRIKTGFYKSHK